MGSGGQSPPAPDAIYTRCLGWRRDGTLPGECEPPRRQPLYVAAQGRVTTTSSNAASALCVATATKPLAIGDGGGNVPSTVPPSEAVSTPAASTESLAA